MRVCECESPAAASSRSGEQAASQAPDAETRRFFGGEDEQLDGAPRLETRALQGADGFQSAQHADGAVVAAARWEWRRYASRCRLRRARIRAGPAREGVADRVFAELQAGLAAKILHKIARAQVRFGEDHARDSGRWLRRNRSLEFPAPS